MANERVRKIASSAIQTVILPIEVAADVLTCGGIGLMTFLSVILVQAMAKKTAALLTGSGAKIKFPKASIKGGGWYEVEGPKGTILVTDGVATGWDMALKAVRRLNGKGER